MGWSDWLSTCGTLAAVGIVIGEYSGTLFPLLDGHVKAIAVGVILFFAALQWRSLRLGSSIQNATSLLKALLLVALVIACFTMPGHARAPSVTNQTTAPPVGWALLAALVVGLQATIYAYDGWDGVIYFGEEVRDPGRQIPRAITASVLAIFAVYLLINAALVYVLPMNEIAGNNFALGIAAERVLGRHGDTVFRIVMSLALLCSINALQLMGTRVIYAMSREGLFFRRAAGVNRGGTPGLAHGLSAAIGVIFATFSFERVIAMLSFFFVANYAISFISLFVLRRREPHLTRPYRAW